MLLLILLLAIARIAAARFGRLDQVEHLEFEVYEIFSVKTLYGNINLFLKNRSISPYPRITNLIHQIEEILKQSRLKNGAGDSQGTQGLALILLWG